MTSIPHDDEHIHDDVVEPVGLSRQPTNTSTFSHVAPQTPSPLRVAVIGGGMGGLCTAIGLLKYPHLDVQVYESAHKFAEIGAGVAFGPNAQRALALIGPHVEQAYLNQATHDGSEAGRYTWFQFRVGMGAGNGQLVSAPSNETGQCSVHRAHFLDEFVALIPPERAHFGKRLVAIEDNTEKGGDVTLHFKDGTTARADAVIGADGVHSVTRDYILGDQKISPQYSGTVVYRGLIPMDEAKQQLGAELAQDSYIWLGYGALVMTYPINFGELMNVVAITFKYPTWDHKEWVLPADVAHVLQDFDGWGKSVTDILKLIKKPSLWSMWDLPPSAFYNKGRVCMMGDAAHASTPYQGQGAGQAIEDALVLQALLGEVHENKDFEHAFAAFDKIRRPRTQKVVTTSREAGLIGSFQAPDIGDDLGKLKANYSTRMDWMWDIDLKKLNEDAITLFRELARRGS